MKRYSDFEIKHATCKYLNSNTSFFVSRLFGANDKPDVDSRQCKKN